MKAVECLNESLGASEVDGTFPMPPTILKPSYNRSPNIFTLFQKVKITHTKRFNSKDK